MPTPAIDDYLKVIMLISLEDGKATTGQIAERLGLSAASVTGMLQKLAEKKPCYVLYEKSHGVRLTRAGQERALEIIRHHRLLETFLHDVLHLAWDKVHDEAERLEHYISEELEDRIAEHLGDPETDPHGSPIPRKDGSLPTRKGECRLPEACPGTECAVTRVSARDPNMLRFIRDLGLAPGARIVFLGIDPFGGPVRIRHDGSERALGLRVARSLFVRELGLPKNESGLN